LIVDGQRIAGRTNKKDGKGMTVEKEVINGYREEEQG
jgi:hypothetical protein